MRSSLARAAVVASSALLAVSATGAHAATSSFKPVAISDTVGDGNGLNDQGFAPPMAGTATPSDYSGGDIVSVEWTTLGKKSQPTGFQVVMKLSGAASRGTIYRVTTKTADCSTFWLNYTYYADGPTSASLQHNCPGFTTTSATGSTESDPLTTVAVAGSTITWTVPASVLPKAVKAGTAITGLSAETRFLAGTSIKGGVTVPQIDHAVGDGTYVYGK